MNLRTSKIKVVIVDDEEHALNSLAQALHHFEDIELVSRADNYKDAKIAVFEHKPQLVFLDVEMPFKNGFVLLNELRQSCEAPFHVIFHTAYEKYTIRALRESAFDFILKPVNTEELKLVLDRYKEMKMEDRENDRNSGSNALYGDIISLPTITGLRFLRSCEIVLFSYKSDSVGGRRYWTALMQNKEEVRLKSGVIASQLLKLSNNNEYIQISQSNILNLSYLSNLEIKTRKCILAIPFHNYQLLASKRYMSKIRERFEFI